MDIEELRDKKYKYYCASISLKNTAIQLQKSMIYINSSKENLEKSYQIDNTTIDDGNIKETKQKIENTISYINNTALPRLENKIREITMEIEMQEL